MDNEQCPAKRKAQFKGLAGGGEVKTLSTCKIPKRFTKMLNGARMYCPVINKIIVTY